MSQLALPLGLQDHAVFESFLPTGNEAQNKHPVRRGFHYLLAIGSGLSVGWLAYAAMTREPGSIAWYFMERSYLEGGGKNVVNVILVDFRGFDTLGEITVLAIAGLGVFALLDGLRLARRERALDGGPWVTEAFPMMLRVVAGWLLPVALLIGIYILLRGHNAPGGGFIAGLVVSVALLIQYMAFGLHSVHVRMPIRYDRVAGVGLLIAASTGFGSFLRGFPFLTSHTAHPVLGWLGEVGLASAAAFDLGVFLVVVGGTLLTVLTLSRVSHPEPDSQSADDQAPGTAALLSNPQGGN